MGLTRNYLVSLLLYISVVNEARLPLVTCQDDESAQRMPKTVFLALLRHPEISSNLAAYSRTARLTQDAKGHNDMSHLRSLTGDGEETEICVPGRVYSQLLKEPVAGGDPSIVSVILNGRAQKLPDFLGRMLDDGDDLNAGGLQPEYQKRSISTLAKNDDLPTSIRDRTDGNEDDEEKRSAMPSEQSDYFIPNGRADLEAIAERFSMDKRNVGSLARDFALPPGRRNIASLIREYDQSTSNRDRVLPSVGKKNVASLARTFTLPQSGKRNVASVAREYGLPYGKRYVGSLARIGDLPARDQRGVSSLARNSVWPVSLKRGSALPGSVILRTLSRNGKSLYGNLDAWRDLLALQELDALEQSQKNDYESVEGKSRDSLVNAETKDSRQKKQIGFSDEYPLPVMQNSNVFDYEELMETLREQYPNTEKRFMGRIPQMGPRPTTPPTRQQGR